MGTATLPASSTMCPSASSRDSSPATRTADGPISTPRRDWPRSRGTPMTRMVFRFGFLANAAGLGAVSTFFSAGLSSTVLSTITVSSFQNAAGKSGIHPVKHSRERDSFANMLQAANPRHHPLDSHTETSVRNAAILAQVQIPLEGRFRQSMFADALQQQIVGSHALRASDDFAVAFGGQDVNAQRQLGMVGIWLHVKS